MQFRQRSPLSCASTFAMPYGTPKKRRLHAEESEESDETGEGDREAEAGASEVEEVITTPARAVPNGVSRAKGMPWSDYGRTARITRKRGTTSSAPLVRNVNSASRKCPIRSATAGRSGSARFA